MPGSGQRPVFDDQVVSDCPEVTVQGLVPCCPECCGGVAQVALGPWLDSNSRTAELSASGLRRSSTSSAAGSHGGSTSTGWHQSSLCSKATTRRKARDNREASCPHDLSFLASAQLLCFVTAVFHNQRSRTGACCCGTHLRGRGRRCSSHSRLIIR